MSDPEYLEIIERASEEFSDHEKLTTARVTRWFNQFMDDDQQLAAKIIGNIEYFSTSRIRGMTNELANICLQYFNEIDHNNIYFVPVGGVTSGSVIIARALGGIKRRTNASWQITSMSDIESLDPQAVKAIVFIDDFSGTGKTLSDWWEVVEPLVLPKQASIVFALLVLNGLARDPILTFADEVLYVTELDERFNVVSRHSNTFGEDERQRLLIYCELTGASDDYIQGYGGCGLLIAFKHGCPNNSLPILWWDSKEWLPLFQRRGL